MNSSCSVFSELPLDAKVLSVCRPNGTERAGMPRRFALVLFIGLTLTIGSSAFADTMFYLTVPENSCSGNNCAPADTVLVDVDLTGTGTGTSTATVTFTGQSVGGNAYSIYGLNFEVNGSFGISEYVVTGGGHAGTFSPVTITPGTLDEYGTFSEGSGVGGTNSVEVFHDASSVEFFLDDGTWTSSANVLAPTPLPGGNPGGYAQEFYAAGQVRVTDCTATTEPGCQDVGTGNEGAIMDSAGFEAAVPEPTSVLLLASLIVLVGLAYRRKRIA